MTLKPRKVCVSITLSALIVVGALFCGCTTTAPSQGTPAPTQSIGKSKVLLATTTSLYDTGLLDYLEPMFEEKHHVDLLITSQGTGKAIEIAKRGDCDILAVHSPSQEEGFMAGGHGINRRCFAYNYFIIVGPADDPASIKDMKPEDAFTKLMTMGKAGTPGIAFVSRGDNSGTHYAEKSIWNSAGYNYTRDVQKSGNWYIEAGRGMGETLQLASEKQAYTLIDEGTYLAYKGNLGLFPIIEQGDILLNVYSVITVYTPTQPSDRITIANNFVNFLTSPEVQASIGEFGKEKYGKNLFIPMTGECSRFKCDCGKAADAQVPALLT
ncbi:MAG TPA: substrate-binding domain-containing protein [Methanolinea sp.]|nr:substrate-binding domain-containing protein [Methanolinea sp.]